MNDTAMMIVLHEAHDTVKTTNGTLEDKLRAAMGVTRDHWMCTDPDAQIRAAVGACMQFYGKDSDEWRRLEYELRQLRKFAAMVGAMQAGLSVDVPETDEEALEPVGIMKLWKERGR